MIYSVRVKNFKSIEEGYMDNLGNINILIGENASGKTAFLESLYLLGEIIFKYLRGCLEYVYDKLILNEVSLKNTNTNIYNDIRGIVPNISNFKDLIYQNLNSIEVELGIEISNEVREKMREYLQERNPSSEIRSTYEEIRIPNILKICFYIEAKDTPAVRIIYIKWGELLLLDRNKRWLNMDNLQNKNYHSGTPNAFYNNILYPEICRILQRLKIHYISSRRRIVEDQRLEINVSFDVKGEWLKRQLFSWFLGTPQEQKKYEKIRDIFKRITGKEIRKMPYYDDVNKKVDVVFEEGKSIVNIDNTGYGYYHILSLIYNIVSSESKVVLIDEPELSLHPQSQIKFFNAIKKISEEESIQFFLATHSPYFVDLERIDKVYKFTKEGTSTIITKIKDLNVIKELKRKKDRKFPFKYRELFFMKKVIFVEGNDDIEGYFNFIKENAKGLEKLEEISEDYFYQLSGSDESRIKLFSKICKDLEIKYVFIFDVDVLVKNKYRKRFMSILKKLGVNVEEFQLEGNSNRNGKFDRFKVREFWEKNWKNYWNKKEMIVFLDKLKKKNIFIMPFWDIKNFNKNNSGYKEIVLKIFKEIQEIIKND